MGKLCKRDNRIFVSSPDLGSLERKYLLNAFDSGWISSRGSYVNSFEQAFSSFIGTNHAVSCSSGTTALHLALLAAGVGPGDEVIIPDLTFVAVANAVLYCGATPVIVDINKLNYTININSIKKAINSKTAAIIAVHLYGQVCNMEFLSSMCRANNIILIEDCAESFGSKYDNSYTGSMGDLSTFSLFANKTLTTGEGGVVCTNNTTLMERLKSLRNHCTLPGYIHSGLGYNYRLTNLQAAIGCAQLQRAEELIERKKILAGWYALGLDSEIKTQPKKESIVPWMYTILTHNRDKYIAYMNSHDIETKPFFPTMSSLEHLPSIYNRNASFISRCGVCLPSSTTLTRKEVKYICEKSNTFTNKRSLKDV